MNALVSVLLFGWIPASLVLFTALGPRRGLIATYLLSSIFLPPVGIDLPGLPDFTRQSAAAIGSVLGTLAFAMDRVAALRPRWFDLPALAMTVLPFVSSMLNGLGAYDGFSAALSSCLIWTIPYFMGRIHLGEPETLRELAAGLTLSGLLCAPMILFEIATGNLLVNLIFGLGYAFGHKYGLLNPALMVGNALQLGIFMAVASVASYGLWITGSARKVAGLPAGLCFAIVTGSTIACHQTAAIGLMVIGLALLRTLALGGPGQALSAGAVLAIPLVLYKAGIRAVAAYVVVLLGAEYLRRINPNRLVWYLILLTPLYVGLRSTGLWDGEFAVGLAYQLFGHDRAGSLGYRFMCENLLIEKALERPIFGWSGWGRSGVEGSFNGVEIVSDGLWVIVLGQNGLAGLLAMISTLVLPLYRFARANPTSTWRDPLLTPAAALGIGLQLYLLDNLLNASISPVPLLISGAMVALGSGPRSRAAGAPDPRLAWADQLVEAGHTEAAEAAYASVAGGGGPAAADAWGRLADLWRSRGRWAEAIEPAERAVAARSAMARSHPAEAAYRWALADDGERLARCLARSGELAAALSLWEDVASSREHLAHELRHDASAREAWARSLNDLAWLMSGGRSAPCGDPERAVALAEQAVILEPDEPAYWNTLGLAYHRCDRTDDAISALVHSTTLGGEGYRGVNTLVMSMAWGRKGNDREATRLLQEADAWLSARPALAEAVASLRGEAEVAERSGSSPA